MPLTFDTISHGTIAFGFFNIESDMLLLEDLFFFASDLCARVSALAGNRESVPDKAHWPVYHIPQRDDIGDLMGAIHGIRHTGFIGDLYRRFPFPKAPEGFKQNPDGSATSAFVEATINKYARRVEISFRYDEQKGEVWIDGYGFTTRGFHALVNYVWVGGYPRWKDEVRPDYVLAMKQRAEESRNTVFKDMVFEA
ncbi:MAG: hypothetical protein JRK53_21205 [Deltaproteobacteria bacterium]|nr:hypothetical protein [Deltaproteobacteria bacterium]